MLIHGHHFVEEAAPSGFIHIHGTLFKQQQQQQPMLIETLVAECEARSQRLFCWWPLCLIGIGHAERDMVMPPRVYKTG